MLTVPAGALDRFYAALERAERKDPAGRVLITVFGDSHTAGDQLTGVLRRQLGARFEAQWHAQDAYDRGNFRGEVVGYVVTERKPVRDMIAVLQTAHQNRSDGRTGNDTKLPGLRTGLGQLPTGKRDTHSALNNNRVLRMHRSNLTALAVASN